MLDKCKERETHFTKWVGVKVRNTVHRKVFLSIHMDKKPMVLVHTCGRTTPGASRVRTKRKLVKGVNVFKRWELKQPDVHAIYRSKFN